MSERPNIVWITLDSVRQDHTTLGDYSRETTPNLARIAETSRGKAFTDCISHGIYTLPSSASILTSTPPTRHTVGFGSESLPSTIPTVAEAFRSNGYNTGCLSMNPYVSAPRGLDRGFDIFKYISPKSLLRQAGLRTTVKYLLNIYNHSAGLSLDKYDHSTAFIMNDVAKRLVSQFSSGSGPFFMYLHYNEPHRPYRPPQPYLDTYTDGLDVSPTEAASIARDIHDRFFEVAANGCEISDEEREALLAMYDAEISYTDECVGRLFDFIQSETSNETIIVVTADHGEAFGEQDMLFHKGIVDDSVINVPLIVHGINNLIPDESSIVQHIDIMRTLLSKVGISDDRFAGIDLTNERREFAVSQRNAQSFDAFIEHNPNFDTSRFHTNPVDSLRSTEYKLVKSEGKTELFAVGREEDDISALNPKVVERLEDALKTWKETEGKASLERSTAEIPDEMQQQLRDLGYR
jgi:arylsulfatase A-like enzyme